jgi:hypothetical protein
MKRTPLSEVFLIRESVDRLTVGDLKKVLAEARDSDTVRVLFTENGKTFSVEAEDAEHDIDCVKIQFDISRI